MTFECPTCGDELPTERGKKMHHSQVHGESLVKTDFEFDCPTCSDSFPTESGMKQHHTRVHGKSIATTEMDCEWCGESIVYNDYELKTREEYFCSDECRYARQSERFEGRECEWSEKIGDSNRGNAGMTGEDNPRWKGGRENRMGPEWATQRRLALKRDFGQCRVCRMDSETHKSKYGRELTVHHKTPRTWFLEEYDDETEALRKSNELNNLITVCRKHHRNLESQVAQ